MNGTATLDAPSGASLSIFDRSGLAALSDLETSAWRELFEHLPKQQSAFLAGNPHSAEYPWPRQCLRDWSRVWEYPYAAHHIRRWHAEQDGHSAPVVDF